MTKILLVEDDKSLREIYGVRLLAEGYDIVSAGDGEAALAMAIKDRPDLILSDVMMPKISGFDMLDILRSTTETRDIKVIMMTALSSEDQRQRGESLGADRYLVKSQVGIEDVVRAVHEVLGDAPTATAAQPTAPPQAGSVVQPSQAQPSSQPTPASQPVNVPPRTPDQQPAPTEMPRPTAPFSTPRPAGLGDRIIHPLTPVSTEQDNMSQRMQQELSTTFTPAAAQPQPQTTSATDQPDQPDPSQSSTDTAQGGARQPIAANTDPQASQLPPPPTYDQTVSAASVPPAAQDQAGPPSATPAQQ